MSDDRATIGDQQVDRGDPDVPGYRFDRYPSTTDPEMEVYVELADECDSAFDGFGNLHVTADGEIVQTYTFDNTADNDDRHFENMTRQAQGFVWGWYQRGVADADSGADSEDKSVGIECVVLITSNQRTHTAVSERFRVVREEEWAIAVDAEPQDVAAYVNTNDLTVRSIKEKTVEPVEEPPAPDTDRDTPRSSPGPSTPPGTSNVVDFM